MSKTRTIDAARIRESAKKIEADMHVIALYAVGLEHELICLHEELEYADPVKDKPFEKFMYKLVRFINALQPPCELQELAQAMQKFGLPDLPAPRSCAAGERSGVIPVPALSKAEGKTGIQSVLIPNIQKHIIEEPIHA